MNVLIIGSGAREHALAWKAAQSPQVNQVYVVPGNAGTALENKVENVNLDPLNFARLIQFAQEKHIQLTIVGPEVLLVQGISDAFQQAGLACFGPNKKAAQLEASKAFSKGFMQRHHIPTAKYQEFSDSQQAKAYCAEQTFPLVIKADGLAAGKGVMIAPDQTAATAAIDKLLVQQKFGAASQAIIVEEFLDGQEASFIIVTDGQAVLPLATSQDHKARDDGDKGPNTGGMGAYSPAPIITTALYDQIMTQIIAPTLAGLRQENITYLGFLYVGLMISPAGEAKVLEFNCRLGDPETQAILMRLRSDLIDLCQTTLNGNLEQYNVAWDPQAAVSVVLAQHGYPEEYQSGAAIHGLNVENSPQTKIFHAGTKKQDNHIVTHGGRVLTVTALGETIQQAQQHAYQHVKQIQWDGMFYRHDIAAKACHDPK